MEVQELQSYTRMTYWVWGGRGAAGPRLPTDHQSQEPKVSPHLSVSFRIGEDLPAASLLLPSHVCISLIFKRLAPPHLPPPPAPPPHPSVNITPGAQRSKQERKKAKNNATHRSIMDFFFFLSEEMEAAAAGEEAQQEEEEEQEEESERRGG